MIFNYEKQCPRENLHEAHEWFFFRNRYCYGLWKTEPDDRDSLSPNELRAAAGLPASHKHRLRLTGWSWNDSMPRGKHSLEASLSFSCKEKSCPHTVNMKRWEYKEKVLDPYQVNQTWAQ